MKGNDISRNILKKPLKSLSVQLSKCGHPEREFKENLHFSILELRNIVRMKRFRMCEILVIGQHEQSYFRHVYFEVKMRLSNRNLL